jgi:glycine/D-amino acid oxidase-like deaminating enzyme
MTASSTAIVVGAGIVGAACAHSLANDGFRVTVIDRGPVAGGATAAGMGHLLVMDDPPAELALTLLSMRLWEEFAELLTHEADYHRSGTLWIAADDEEMIEAASKLRRLRAAGFEARLVDASHLQRLEPNLAPGLVGGLQLPADGIVYAPKAAAWFFRRAGVRDERLVTGHAATSIRSRRVTLDDGRVLEADVIVNAAGLDARTLGEGLPLRARKGHLIITDRHPGFCSHQIVELGYIKNAHGNAAESVAFNLQPRPNGQLLLGSSRQFDVESLEIEHRMLTKVIDRGVRFMPGLASLKGIRAWTGLRAVTPDGLPIIGEMPGQPGVFAATGHEGLGITTSLGTGRLIADLVAGRRPAIDASPYSPARFAAGGSND